MSRHFFALLILNILYTGRSSTIDRCPRPDWLRCTNGKCISATFECDGEDDCGDTSDEKDCADYTFSPPSGRCAEDEYQCKDHACIPSEKFCDATSDCPDNSDEYDGCVKELNCTQFRCKNGYCISNDWICDGVADCTDKTDELNCKNKTISASECNNDNDRYLCKNQRCIPLSAACNGKDDCGDGTDESHEGCQRASLLCTRTAKCNQNCRKTPEGPKCTCNSGYKLINNRTCTDVDECQIYGICDQHCVNNLGSYDCACEAGYIMDDDKKKCLADGGEALMVLSVKSEIRGYYLRSEIYYPVIRNVQYAVAVSLDSNYIYWSDIEDGEEAIVRSLEDGTERKVIVTTGLNSPEDIAVDWVTGNIYFSDSGYLQIGVCTIDGSHCTVILKERTGKPRGLALLPSNGLIYWTEWSLNPHIMVAGMDGKNSSEFLTEGLEWPNGLAIDYANNRLYWVDAKLKMIQSIRLDGSDRRIVLKKTVKKPYSLAIFENKLYWTDWSTNSIESCDKFTGKDWKIVLRENSTVYGLHIYHSVLKPKIRNPCNANPCSELCLLNREDGYTCACTLDKELASDQHTCRAIKKKQHLIIGAGNTFINYYHELLGNPKMKEFAMLKHVTALAYNSLTGAILASDQLTDSIFHYNANQEELKSLIRLKNEYLGGMDFDYIGNNLYLTDMKHKTIEVHSLNKNEKTVFYFQDQPSSITVVPEEGVMFAVFHEDRNNQYRIDKMRMDGLGPTVQITGNTTPLLGPKISLCYDRDLKRLFWSDQGSGRIESVAIDLKSNKVYDKYLSLTGLFEPVSLAIVDEHIFWTQKGSNRLYSTDKISTNQYQKHITLHAPKDMDLQLLATRGTYVNENHECYKNNGNCSHVCLVSDSHSRICACPPDMMLNLVNQTCTAQTACKPGEVKCGEHDLCIKLQQRCDGVRDCPNGEDESSSCGEFNSCGSDRFKCKSGECISSKKRCNFHYDCVDKSDEDDCQKKECETTEFQCHEGACISKSLVCNGVNECPDLSDESNCGTHTCGVNTFTCNTGKCIPNSWTCDGEHDCKDGEDEGETCQFNSCSPDMFMCHNHRCIDLTLKCNGIDDCQDESDENYCLETYVKNFINCTKEEYRCFDAKKCIPKNDRCNGIRDCPNNDDEHGCPRCGQNEFACKNRKCIPRIWVCDTTDDCGDRSDEMNCDGSKSKSRSASKSSASKCKEFQCPNGDCLPYSKVCDEISDCANGDELGNCSIACTMDNPCENKCYQTPLGPVCGCQSGFQLKSDLRTCEDIDECQQNICSHNCHNTIGSFICSCYKGYVLRNDRTSCKMAGPQMEIITAAGNGIRKLSPTLNSIEVIHDEDNNFDITGIDVNAKEDAVYWCSSDALGVISKLKIKSKEQKMVTGVGRPEAVAVDWVTDNVYFNDNDGPSSIKVCNLEQQKCVKLISIEGRSKLTSIAVDPTHGWLFWSQIDWQSFDKNPASAIYRSDTTGNNKMIIVPQHIGIVNGITIDYMRSKLYWADSFLKIIETTDLNGNNRAVFLETRIYEPLSLNIYEDSLYWLMGTTGQLQNCKLHGEKSCKSLPIGISNIGKHFVILHSSRQFFEKSTCEDHNCDYMCVRSVDGFTCICQNGMIEESNNSCTKHHNSRMVFTTGNASRKGDNSRHQGGTLIGIIMTVVVCIVLVSGYFYYQRIKPQYMKKHDFSMHFQNPSYDRRDEIVATLNCVSALPPGEHEYINPLTNIAKKKHEKKLIEVTTSDQSDIELENSESKRNTYLIQ